MPKSYPQLRYSRKADPFCFQRGSACFLRGYLTSPVFLCVVYTLDATFRALKTTVTLLYFLIFRSQVSTTEFYTLAKKGETLKHLWKKYNAAGTVNGRKPLSYRQYCRRYTNWLDSTKVTFHIQRYPGVNLELDFAGKPCAFMTAAIRN